MPDSIQPTGSAASRFYKNVPIISGDKSDNNLPFDLENFASMCIEAVYVIDFHKRGFCYVADHDFFLCGHSTEKAMALGYGFYSKVIHGEDLPLLEEMHAAIFRRLYNMGDNCGINFFSFTVRIKNGPGYLMAHHKIKPVFINGHIRFGIVLLASSTVPVSGFLRAYFFGEASFDEYLLKKERWKKRTVQALTEREKTILKFSKQGKTGKEIANIIGMTHQALRNALETIYQKLNVHSLMQAVIFATNHRLIFIPEQYHKNLKHEVQSKIKKQRRPMTPEKLPHIQEKLNSGQSINSIAKQENISEFTIRYAVKTGKLIKRHG
jgi:DNA-binding NarL/FixJ family response regulator